MRAPGRARLVAVARGARPADLVIRGGRLLDVYTGEVYEADVAVAGERIAHVGRRADLIGPRTRVLDAGGRVLVPGYVEPHAHPFLLSTPTGLARHVLPLGTTTLVADNLPVFLLGGERGFHRAVRALAASPLKVYWMVRPHGQSHTGDDAARFPLPALRRMLASPWSVAVGEVTRWPDVARGRRALLERLALAAALGKRVEGHTAGARPERLAAIAAAGVTSDHEPITGAEALARARLGIALMLRNSSLRRDLGALLPAFVGTAAAGRLMLTTDGSTPAFVAERGFTDHLVRLALDAGVPPVDAYRMVTLNPAAYYGRDADWGGIAPGRYADVLLLDRLEEPRPRVVVARGRPVARDGALTVRLSEPRWAHVFPARSAGLGGWRARPEDFTLPPGPLPVIRLVSAVITRLETRPAGEGDLHVAALDRRGRRITSTALAGFAAALDGLATTLSTDYQVLALGRRPAAMARAVNRLLALGGGVVLVDGDRVVFELALPVAGIMSTRPVTALAEAERTLAALLRARGHPYHDPSYSLLFLAADFLPEVRLSARGVLDVKRARVLRPSRPRRPG